MKKSEVRKKIFKVFDEIREECGLCEHEMSSLKMRANEAAQIINLVTEYTDILLAPDMERPDRMGFLCRSTYINEGVVKSIEIPVAVMNELTLKEGDPLPGVLENKIDESGYVCSYEEIGINSLKYNKLINKK